mgnify:FL=1
MTREEFDRELEAYGIPKYPTAEDYNLIEKVYTYHPAISEVRGKAQVAALYAELGICVFHDMEPTADRAMRLESDIRAAKHELSKLLDEYNDLQKGCLK